MTYTYESDVTQQMASDELRAVGEKVVLQNDSLAPVATNGRSEDGAVLS